MIVRRENLKGQGLLLSLIMAIAVNPNRQITVSILEVQEGKSGRRRNSRSIWRLQKKEYPLSHNAPLIIQLGKYLAPRQKRPSGLAAATRTQLYHWSFFRCRKKKQEHLSAILPPTVCLFLIQPRSQIAALMSHHILKDG